MRCMKALVILAALAAFPVAAQETVGPSPTLPSPNATPSAVNFSTVVGWLEGRTPTVAEGFEVARYAGGLDYPAGSMFCPTATCWSPKPEPG